MIHSVYLNEVVLPVTFFGQIIMEELSVDFDTGKQFHYFPIHDFFRAFVKYIYYVSNFIIN